MSTFVLWFAVSIGALGLVLLALWWRARRRARAAAPETAQAAPPQHHNCRCTVDYSAPVVLDNPQRELDPELRAAINEFYESIRRVPEESRPDKVKVRLPSGLVGSFTPLRAPKPQTDQLSREPIEEPGRRCISCGRPLHKHRHNCPSRRRS